MALRSQHVAPELLNKVTKALGITALDQWYYVSHHAAFKAIGSRALNEFGGSLASFLHNAYPNHHFDEQKLSSRVHQEKDQKFIEVIIRQLFPNTEIRTKARKSVGIINPETDAYLEIDFWIPSLKLGIEYQDKHHYGYQWYANDTLDDYKKRDDIKKDTMSKLGYTLITIGYWWNKSVESIAATIRKYRPDLLQNYESVPAEPIPSEPPLNFIYGSPVIPGVSGIMSPFVPTNSFNPTNWYGGEKYDGVRGVYNPDLSKMFSRSGNALSILPTLLKDIPSMLVEGEITAGRGNYTKTAAVSFHTHYDSVNWPMFRYVMFDVPDAEQGNYTQRYSSIAHGLEAHTSVFSQLAFRVLLVDKYHLKVLLDEIISDAGEGVIAQQDTRYEYGRARGLAKIKVHRDADAQVLHINETSCTCKLVSGATADIAFVCGFDTRDLKVGDIVSYYHYGYTQSGLPKRGEIYKIRYDISWNELTADKMQSVTKRRSVSEAIGSSALLRAAQKRKGYWNKAQNARAFFDEVARISGFDPLVTENWYSVKGRTLLSAGSGGLLKAYDYNKKKALSSAYPELTFDSKKFRRHCRHKARNKPGHWNNPENVRAFFDEFARTSGFDPMVPENWYPVRLSSLFKAKGMGVLGAYDFKLQKALVCAYPSLKLKPDKFITHQTKVNNGHWGKAENVRAFFDEFARRSEFNPLLADNWYLVKHRALHNAGGKGLLYTYGNSIKDALSLAYPELKLDVKQFRAREIKGHWCKSTNVRAFFDEFARTSGFDALVPENWLRVDYRTLRSTRHGNGILSAYSNIRKAVSFAYPELSF